MHVDADEPGLTTGISTPSHGEPRSGAATPTSTSELEAEGSLEIVACRERLLHAEGQTSKSAKNSDTCARRLMGTGVEYAPCLRRPAAAVS